MALTRLVSVHNATVGATAIARPVRASASTSRQAIESRSDGLVDPHNVDHGPWDIRTRIEAEDPTIIPTVSALTFPLAITGTGRVINTATFSKFTQTYGVLIGVSLTLEELQAASVAFDFVSQGSPASTVLSNELAWASASAPTSTSRRTAVRFAATGHSFTPDGGGGVTILGLRRLTWNAQANGLVLNASPGVIVIDGVDFFGWRISGQMTFSNLEITSSLSAAEYLASLIRGTLVVRTRMSGISTDATPPTDQAWTIARMKFTDTDENLQSRQVAGVTVNYEAVQLAANGTEVPLASMLAVDAAA
jgi:hypothetical protein